MNRVFSGVQPTNLLHLGNYLGAIKNWIELQKDHDCFYCVVDLHALTDYRKPAELKQNILNTARAYLALGVDPARSVIFAQSAVPSHTELAWILNCQTKIGELERMTQFKDKSKRQKGNINAGLFTYPVLMAADILLYDAAIVPVGEDQKQHVELTRDLALRFNKLYGRVFTLPKPLIKTGGRVMSLTDPTKKMSKSDANANSFISLLDDAKTVEKKMSRAVTDSGKLVCSGPDKPALTNLLTIYALLADQPLVEVEKACAGFGYADFKKGLAGVINRWLAEFQEKFYGLTEKTVLEVLAAGQVKAQTIAAAKLTEVKEKIDLL
jgi:tryptophanyl-tRNA synthetase